MGGLEVTTRLIRNLERRLEVSHRWSRWLLGDTTCTVRETGAGLVTVRLQEAGDLLAATNSLQAKAAS